MCTAGPSAVLFSREKTVRKEGRKRERERERECGWILSRGARKGVRVGTVKSAGGRDDGVEKL